MPCVDDFNLTDREQARLQDKELEVRRLEALDRLEDKGWLASTTSPARPERGGRPRRIVRVTPEGVDALRKSREALLTLWDGLEHALDA